VANEGETIAFYTGDTLYYPDLAREARGARVLLAEATLPREIDPEKAGMHMSVADTLRLASESGAGMLILLHLTPESLEEAVGLESPAHMPVLFGEGYSIIV
jgi:ribonuclease BN (tRNA processing enzyme)